MQDTRTFPISVDREIIMKNPNVILIDNFLTKQRVDGFRSLSEVPLEHWAPGIVFIIMGLSRTIQAK
jgi:hypothetical protein